MAKTFDFHVVSAKETMKIFLGYWKRFRQTCGEKLGNTSFLLFSNWYLGRNEQGRFNEFFQRKLGEKNINQEKKFSAKFRGLKKPKTPVHRKSTVMSLKGIGET